MLSRPRITEHLMNKPNIESKIQEREGDISSHINTQECNGNPYNVRSRSSLVLGDINGGIKDIYTYIDLNIGVTDVDIDAGIYGAMESINESIDNLNKARKSRIIFSKNRKIHESIDSIINSSITISAFAKYICSELYKMHDHNTLDNPVKTDTKSGLHETVARTIMLDFQKDRHKEIIASINLDRNKDLTAIEKIYTANEALIEQIKISDKATGTEKIKSMKALQDRALNLNAVFEVCDIKESCDRVRKANHNISEVNTYPYAHCNSKLSKQLARATDIAVKEGETRHAIDILRDRISVIMCNPHSPNCGMLLSKVRTMESDFEYSKALVSNIVKQNMKHGIEEYAKRHISERYAMKNIGEVKKLESNPEFDVDKSGGIFSVQGDRVINSHIAFMNETIQECSRNTQEIESNPNITHIPKFNAPKLNENETPIYASVKKRNPLKSTESFHPDRNNYDQLTDLYKADLARSFQPIVNNDAIDGNNFIADHKIPELNTINAEKINRVASDLKLPRIKLDTQQNERVVKKLPRYKLPSDDITKPSFSGKLQEQRSSESVVSSGRY